MKYIQLDCLKNTKEKQQFAKDSILVSQAQNGNEHVVVPVKAWDEQGLPYYAYKNSYNISLTDKEYHQVKPITASYIGTSFPKDDVGDDPLVSLSLADIYDDKPYIPNGDGLIHLKQSQKKTASDEESWKAGDKVMHNSSGETGSLVREVDYDEPIYNRFKRAYAKEYEVDFEDTEDPDTLWLVQLDKEWEGVLPNHQTIFSENNMELAGNEEGIEKESNDGSGGETGNMDDGGVMARKKTAEGENHLTDNQDEITTDFKKGVGGQNDPGLHPNFKEDVTEKPAPAPILGPLAKKIGEIQNILKVKSNTEPNHQTPNNDSISTDFNTGVGGSATFNPSAYKEDSGNKDWKDPFLGETSAKNKK